VIGKLSEKINKVQNENEDKENSLKIQLKMQRKVLKSKDNIICFLATMCVAMFGLVVGIICKHFK
jgi:tetrahydromethanopterin S-methyltransferase subunit B